MELTHSFTVPADLEHTWAAFNDIESVAGCFPGAQITSAEGDSFAGSVKVKLGPIALLYNGSGEFTEKDEAGHRLVIKASGKDRRGNGTAGADVVATMTAVEGGTSVEVVTDLAITGKPAQFGRGLIQDVSDKLLAQFAGCLEQKVGATPVVAEPASDGSASDEGPGIGSDAGRHAGPTSEPGPGPSAASAGSQESLDLGATVLPVLVKSYGKQALGALGVLLVLWWLVRRLRG